MTVQATVQAKAQDPSLITSTDSMLKQTRRRVDLLITLALLHLGHGQKQRGLTYAMLANTFAPVDHAARRVLAFGLYRNGAQSEALEIIDSLRAEIAPARDRILELMRAESLKARGHEGDDLAAQDSFWQAMALSKKQSVVSIQDVL